VNQSVAKGVGTNELIKKKVFKFKSRRKIEIEIVFLELEKFVWKTENL
jgi:hypothetical protein